MLKLKLKFGVFDHPLDAIFHLIKLSVLPIEVVDESLLGQSEFFNQILFSFDWGNRWLDQNLTFSYSVVKFLYPILHESFLLFILEGLFLELTHNVSELFYDINKLLSWFWHQRFYISSLLLIWRLLRLVVWYESFTEIGCDFGRRVDRVPQSDLDPELPEHLFEVVSKGSHGNFDWVFGGTDFNGVNDLDKVKNVVIYLNNRLDRFFFSGSKDAVYILQTPKFFSDINGSV